MNKQIARAAGTVAIAIFLGQIMGLLRGILVARTFVDADLDAFFAANRVSETLFTLIAAGALGSAFLPTFTGLLVNDKKDQAWKLAASIANLVTIALSMLAALAAMFAPQIVRYLLAPGLFHDFLQYQITIDLLRIQLISAVLFGLGGLVISILNAHRIFFIPQLTASMYQIGQIFGVLVLSRWMGIYGLAWGVVIGSGLFLLIQLPTLLKQQGKYVPSLGLHNPSVRRVISLMGPRVLGAGVVQLNFWVNTWLASQMEAGSVTGLYYGFALMLMAQAAIAQSAAIASMPTFSAQFALGKLDEMRHALSRTLQGMLLFAMPASIGLMLLSTPIVTMLYQGSDFTHLAAWALLWYAAGLVAHAILELLTRAFYAQQDTITPVVAGIFAMGFNVALSFGLSAWFRQIGWMPLGGLALANSLATTLEVIVLFIIMRNRLHGIEGKSLLNGILRILAASTVMALTLFAWLSITKEQNPWIVGIGGIAAGGSLYVISAMLLKIPEVHSALGALKQRLKRYTRSG